VHADCLAAVGMRDPGTPAHYYRAFQGRIYANVSYFGYLFSQTPIGTDERRFLRGFTDDSVNLSRYRSPYGPYSPGRPPVASWWFWVRIQAQLASSAARHVAAMAEQRRLELERFRALSLPSLPLVEVGVELDNALSCFRSMYAGYMAYFFNAHLLQGAAAAIAQRWLAPRDAEPFAQTLAATMSVGTERARLLHRLACRAEGARVASLIGRSNAHELEVALSRDPAGRTFLSETFKPFLREHGFWGRREMELMKPRWSDEPALLFEELRARMAQPGTGPDAQTGPIALPRGLPRHRRVALAALEAATRRWARYRFATRQSVLAAIWRVRSLVLELGDPLARRGVLHTRDEVAYLELDELRAFAAGHAQGGAVLRRTIEARRRLHLDHCRAPEPPPVLPAGRLALFSEPDVA
jgi:pyruvate,water dikinase